jgi:uncharacterized protein YjiS (DUF1127 family)
MTTHALTVRFSRNLIALLRPLQRRNSIAHLSSRDDRLLRDIGLRRLDVDDMRRMW